MKPHMLKRGLMKQFIPVAVIAAVAAVLLANPALAKKSGPSVAVNPTTPLVKQAVVFTGCGYQPNAPIKIGVQAPYAAISFQSTTDSSGCFDSSTFENFAPLQPGDYYVDTWQGGHRALAGLEFTVLAG
jgi:hypothetical protein